MGWATDLGGPAEVAGGGGGCSSMGSASPRALDSEPHACNTAQPSKAVALLLLWMGLAHTLGVGLASQHAMLIVGTVGWESDEEEEVVAEVEVEVEEMVEPSSTQYSSSSNRRGRNERERILIARSPKVTRPESSVFKLCVDGPR